MVKQTTVAEDDWESLTEEWQAPVPPIELETLRARVRSRTRWRRAAFIGEIILTLVAIVIVVGAAGSARTWDAWIVIAGLSIFTLVIWTFGLRNRRGTWRAVADTLEAYQALEALRAERRIAAATFTRRLCLLSTIPLLALAAYRWSEGPGWSQPVAICLGAIAYLLIWVFLAWRIERRARN